MISSVNEQVWYLVKNNNLSYPSKMLNFISTAKMDFLPKILQRYKGQRIDMQITRESSPSSHIPLHGSILIQVRELRPLEHIFKISPCVQKKER